MNARLAFKARPELLLALVAALFQAVDMLLVVALDALFLRRLGASYLPSAYVVLNTGSMLLSLVVLSFRSFSTFWLSFWMTAGLTITAVVAIPFLKGNDLLGFFLIFLVVRLHDKLALSYFLTYVQGIFPVREAKQKMAFILGASSVACVLSGLSVKPLVMYLSMEALFAVAAVLGLVLAVLMHACVALWPLPVPTAVSAGAEQRQPLKEALYLLKESRLALRLAVIFFLTMFLRNVIEYQFSREAVLLFPSDNQLASFSGNFKAGTSLAFTLCQFLLTGVMLMRLQPGGTMTVAAVVQTVLALLAVAVSGPVPIFLLQAFWMVGFQVCLRPALGLLLSPLDAVTRDRVGILTSLADALGCVLSGLVLIVIQGIMTPSLLFIAIALLYGVALVVSRHLNDDYFDALSRAVTAPDPETKVSLLAALSDLSPQQTFKHLEILLQDADCSVRLEAAARLGALPPAQARPLLERALQAEADPRVLAQLAREAPHVLGDQAAPLLLSLCAGVHDARPHDPRVLANLIESIGEVGTAVEVEALAPWLSHPVPRVQAAAVLSMVRRGRARASLDAALTALARMLNSPGAPDRSAAVAVLGELRQAAFVPAAVEGLVDDAPEVRSSAVRALSKLRPARALQPLRELARTDPAEEIRTAAGRTADQIESQSMDQLLHLVIGRNAAERTGVRTFLRSAREESKLELLERLLRMNLPSVPPGLLDLLRLTDDARLLQAVSGCLERGRPTLLPLLAVLESGSAPVPMRFLKYLGMAFPEECSAELIGRQVGLIHGLVRANQVEPAGELLERTLSWVAALDPAETPEDLLRILHAAIGLDRHRASMSLDLLEARLPAALYRVIGPLVEAWADPDKRFQMAQKWLELHPASEVGPPCAPSC
jgi:HEAT repeat protein